MRSINFYLDSQEILTEQFTDNIKKAIDKSSQNKIATILRDRDVALVGDTTFYDIVPLNPETYDRFTLSDRTNQRASGRPVGSVAIKQKTLPPGHLDDLIILAFKKGQWLVFNKRRLIAGSPFVTENKTGDALYIDDLDQYESGFKQKLTKYTSCYSECVNLLKPNSIRNNPIVCISYAKDRPSGIISSWSDNKRSTRYKNQQIGADQGMSPLSAHSVVSAAQLRHRETQDKISTLKNKKGQANILSIKDVQRIALKNGIEVKNLRVDYDEDSEKFVPHVKISGVDTDVFNITFKKFKPNTKDDYLDAFVSFDLNGLDKYDKERDDEYNPMFNGRVCAKLAKQLNALANVAMALENVAISEVSPTKE